MMLKRKLWKQITAIVMACAVATGTAGTNTALAAGNNKNITITNKPVKVNSKTAKESSIAENIKPEERTPELDMILEECEEIKTDGTSREIRKGQMVSVSSISDSDYTRIAIMENGDLYCWGYNYYGQIGNGNSSNNQLTPFKVLSDVKYVSCSANYCISAITENGDLYCWGRNNYGEVGNGSTITQTVPVKVLSDVKYVVHSSNYSHSSGYSASVSAIMENGDLYCWGYNNCGQVGNNSTNIQRTPFKVLSGVKSVSYSDYYCISAITESGDLYCWGYNNHGQAGNGSTINQLIPLKILSNIKLISYSHADYTSYYDYYSCSISAITKNGDLYCWGYNSHGQVGNGTIEDQLIPFEVLSGVKSVSYSYYSYAYSYYLYSVSAIMENGDLYCWGYNGNGEIGNGTTKDQLIPFRVLSNVKSVSYSYYSHYTSSSSVSAITENGDLYCWGYNGNGQIGNGTTKNQLTPFKVLSNVKYVSYSLSYSISAITESGDLYCWGRNNCGEVGNGSTDKQMTPVKVLSNVKSISYSYADPGGASSSVSAIKENGDLYCWGLNEDGEVGNDSTTKQTIPVKVLSDVKSVSYSDYSSVTAITENGDLYCWGYNSSGQVGNGTAENQLTPYKVLFEDSSDNIARFTLSETTSAILNENNSSFTFSGHIYLKDGKTASSAEWQSIINNINWTSSDPSVVTDIKCLPVTGVNGQRDIEITVSVSLKSAGTATVTGTTANSLSSSCDITVEILKDNDIKKHIISLSPKQNYNYKDLSDVKCIIKFDKEIKNIKSGAASLIEYNTNKIIEKINLKESIKNSDGKVVLSTDAITIIFNKKWEEQTLLFPNTKYYILIEGSTIELDGGYLLTGIEEKNYWSFTTIPIEHSLIKNSQADDKEIELSKYMTYFKPLTALHIRERDDGTNGLCFGISYATGAWNNNYSGVHSIGKDVNSLMDMKLSTRGDLQYTFWEYLQLAQIAQYTPEMDSILKNNEVNEKKSDKIQDFYDAVKNFQNNTGDMVIFGAFNHEKIGHAIVPIGISYEDNDVAIIKVYNCNGEGENLFNNKFVYDLTLKKENGKFVDWDFLSFNNKDGKKGYFRFCTVDEVIDMAVRIANSEKKEFSNLVFSDSELGGLEEIGSCTNTLTDKLTQHLYWINDTSIMRQISGNDNPSEIGITDGEKEISAVMPLDTKVELDLDSEFINASLSKISDYSLSFVSSNIDNTILSIVINGRTGGEVLAEQTKNGITLKADDLSNTEIVIKDGDRSNKLIFSSEKKCVLINATDEKVVVSEDSNGDGQYDKEIASMEIIKAYTIDYILNGGNVSGNPVSYMADTLPITLKNPTRNGYIFTGWTGSNGSIPQISVTITKGTTGKLNYTANWEKITYSPSPSTKPSGTGSSGGGTSGSGGGAVITPTSTPVATLTPSPSPVTITTSTPKPSSSTNPGTASGSIVNNNSKKEITSDDVTLNKKSVIYSGKEKKPSVTVLNGSLELTKNKDYTVSYLNNKNVGTATVVVNGIGNYTGSITKSFKIIPKGTPLKGKVKSKHKGFTVNWKKQPKSITGYQVQYSTSKKFKGKTTVIKTVKKKSVTKLKASKLKAKKKYYVRVRTYKTVKGKKYYSRWSKSKTVKTKK